ncbi:MAG TPA: ROK family protein [Solirubrobacteraceae bacterium]|jgi:glucokinase
MHPKCVIGVDLGGTKLIVGALDEQLRVLQRVQRPAPGADQKEVLDTVVDAVEEVRASSPVEVSAVGFGIPCLIDQDRGVAVMAVNLPLADIDFRAVMSERLGLPAFVDNDANVAALAEHRAGAARGCSHAAMLTVGTGIGGGLILSGRLYRGAHGAAGELGHMVIDENGPPCQGNCPNHGCLESLASGTALAREALALAHERPDSSLGRALASGRAITGALVTELAHDGDSEAIGLIELIGRRLGVGIVNLVNMLNLEVIVVGGGVIAAGELLLEPARRVLAERGLRPSREQVRVERAHFGTEAGMIGAAALAFDGLDGLLLGASVEG